jgi:hypothetical protein
MNSNTLLIKKKNLFTQSKSFSFLNSLLILVYLQ